MIYAYNSPIILTDELYSAFGGHTDNSTDRQRKAAYFIAERQMSDDLETYLLPTIVTGTYLYRSTDKFLTLDNTYVTKIIKTSFLDTEEKVYWSQLGTANLYISLRDGERGLVDIHYILGSCNCSVSYPYQVQEVYEAGLSSGTSFRDDILLGLTTYADIILNEIIGYGNESSGDIGVQKYDNQQYSEERVKLLRTSFGTSARAQFVLKLIEKHRRKRFVSL
jgi:hypothetical protein